MGKRTGNPRGRPKGSQNKNKNTGIVLAHRKGVSPLEFLLSVMDDVDKELNVRMDAAKSAAPYCHQRLAQLAVEHKGEVYVNKVEHVIVYPTDTDSESISATH